MAVPKHYCTPSDVLRMLVPTAWIATISLVATVALAASIDQLSNQDLTNAADTIVEGTVSDVHSQWNAGHTQIRTTVSISVSNLFKGVMPPGGVLTFDQLGGQVGDMVMEVSGLAGFTAGESVIVFLRNGTAPLTPLVGWSQGKVTVVVDATTGIRKVQERGVPRDEFVSEISRIIAEHEGGDGR